MGHRAEIPTAVLMLKIIVPIAAFAMASLPTLAVSQPVHCTYAGRANFLDI